MATTALTPFDDAFWRDDRAVAFRPVAEEAAPPPWLGDEAARGLVFFRTSGSEGRPKWVGLTRPALLASAGAVNSFLGVARADVWLRALPIFHVGGFGVEARAWLAGARLIRGGAKWNAAEFVATCFREGVTLTSLVPTQVFDLAQAKLVAPPALRAVVVGGGPLRPALWQRGRELGWPLLTSYGLTEAASQVATLSPGEADPARLTVLPLWQVEVTKAGCLQLRGPALATCYFTGEAAGPWHREDIGGQLTTADRVVLEPAPGATGLRLLGRRDRTVKIRGELVDLDAVEAVVADAAVELSIFGLVHWRSEVDERAGYRLVLESLEKTAGQRVMALANSRLPACARLAEVRVVKDLRLSALGKPVL